MPVIAKMPTLALRSIRNWPAESREAARRVIEQYGEPDEITDTTLIWNKRGPWRQIVASKALFQHNFPAPHYTLFALEPSEDKDALASMAAAKVGKRRVRKGGSALAKLAAAETAHSAA
ncbi:MAG TPA: hypothetical protein VL492_02525 [Methylovirgula sp.]|jgi:hypothetical protein|nr:hypothetical protein [Methylovirgula sp.]